MRQIQISLSDAFEYLDDDCNGMISDSDIDQAVVDLRLPAKVAAGVAILKAHRRYIKALHRDSWCGEEQGISSNDVEKLFELFEKNSDPEQDGDNLSGAEAYDKDDPREIVRSIRRISKRVEMLQQMKVIPVYEDEDQPISCIKPDAIIQGRTGDCYFLAALASVVAANPQMIIKIIKTNGAGGYKVTFPGLREEVIELERPTVIELALYARLTSCGSWPAILEKAYGSHLRKISLKPRIVAAENISNEEPMSELYRVLTGQTCIRYKLKDLTHDALAAGLAKSSREGRAMTFGADRPWQKYTSDAGLITRHAYSLLKWDSITRRATLRNPWGSQGRGNRPASDDHVQWLDGGSFTLDLTHLLLNLDCVFVEKWRQEENFTDSDDGFSTEQIARP